MLKVVVDANVWVSALINQGPPHKVVKAFKDDLFQAFYPSQLLVELSDVLSRERLRPRLNPEQVPELLNLIETKAILVAVDPTLSVSRDPKDNAYLACADAANCDFLVTGDRKGLLYLVEYGTAKIVMAAEFLRILNW